MMLGVLDAQHGWSLYAVIPLCLVTGAVIGLINGAFVMGFGIDPFIVTLGTGTFLHGIVLWISNSMTFSGISPDLVNAVVVDRFLGIPLEFYYGLGLCAVLWYLFEFTAMGRRLLFVGRGRDVARLSGLRVGRLRWGALVACGVISAGAGILYAGTTGSADPTSGSSYLLPAFAAAFLGATTIAPGRFNPWGSFVAVYFLVTGITGLSLFGVRSFIQDLFYGGALVIAVTLSQLARSRAAHESGPSETS
jgi:ribose transport system permease protein